MSCMLLLDSASLLSPLPGHELAATRRTVLRHVGVWTISLK